MALAKTHLLCIRFLKQPNRQPRKLPTLPATFLALLRGWVPLSASSPAGGWVPTHSWAPSFSVPSFLLELVWDLPRNCPLRVSSWGLKPAPPLQGVQNGLRPVRKTQDPHLSRTGPIGACFPF